MMLSAVIGISPLETPDASLVEALEKAGAIGVLDLGRDQQKARDALAKLTKRRQKSYGVRMANSAIIAASELPAAVTTVVLDAADLKAKDISSLDAWRAKGREIWLQVCSYSEALAWSKADGDRPDGLIVKGSESGGRVGPSASFILIQEIQKLGLPFWVQGGIGPHTAAAAMIGGAAGVVLDSQLVLFRESAIHDDIKKAVKSMEGTETRVIHNHQVYTRPDLKLPHEGDISAEDFTNKIGGWNLKDNFIPAGQDLCLAAGLAAKYLSIRTLVQSLQRSMKGHLRQAKVHVSIAPHSALAASNGTDFAIAQGPMTRVSDRPEFIDAVAEGGALPFLALSLMRKNECMRLLEETQALLGTKPWGVGILGFVPEELQKEQLEALASFSPSAMLIAGGRPSQAEPFEKRGIKTFLHVPSPGLLKQFLKDGARRFIFEGRECGGHVGPRSSFVLWETQIDILLKSEAVHELEVFFAGGIHDGLSAAMVNTMAAPLAARGAKIGVLIGTAYLFTEEAVRSGAILKRFQDEAIRCEETALLETAPGHAVRCANTPFVDAFAVKKEELRTAGLDAKEAWAELEALNVGKLRIASKGLERVGNDLVAVADERQVTEGMYMLGQVAQMRDQVLTMRQLHEQISEGAAEILARAELPEEESATPSDIAVVGMACVFPGSEDLNGYWRNILTGADLVTEVPDTRWNKQTYFSENMFEANKSISKWGGFISAAEFDPLEFGIPPNSMPSIEPTQLLSLKIAKRALEDAGYITRSFDRERTSVIFGAEAGTDLASAYGFRALFPQYAGAIPKELDEFLPSLTEDSFPGVLANVISGRVANRLDLGGSNYTVDAACASSLAALDLAVKELIEGESDMVLCGGADLHNSINDYLMFSSVKALSSSGRSRPFSAEADGIVLAEGVAVVVLKRLEDAERDGDRIYSVIKAVGSSSDGKSFGLTAPRKEGQMRALHRAYARAGINPAEIELVEAHGTGTVVGDRTELETLSEVYSEAGALNRTCALGSVKSQIGHSKCAAGLAGLIKSSLALYHGIIPPTLHTAKPNPGYQEQSSPFYFSPVAVPWMSEIRKAAVSAFGFGGTNFHAILVSHKDGQEHTPASRSRAAELFLFESADELEVVKEVLARNRELDFGRLARTVTLGTSAIEQGAKSYRHKAVKFAIVAKDANDLSQKIDRALEGTNLGSGVYASRAEAQQTGKIAILFSGQGSQSINMGAEIFNTFPALRPHLERGQKWASKVFPKGVVAGSEETLKQTRNTQPALGIVDLAFYDLMQAFGIEADMLGGHSYGELVALAASGSLAAEDLLTLSEARALAIESAAQGKQGAMAAVSGSYEAVEAAIKGLSVVIANHNAPTQVVISGEAQAIDEAIAHLKTLGLAARKIPVSAAFHSPLLAEAEGLFAKALAPITLKAPHKVIYSNTTAAVHDNSRLKAAYAKQIVEPVRFVKQIEQMHSDGARLFLEVGPGAVLKGLIDRILDGKEHVTRSLGKTGNSLEALLSLVAELSTLGLRIDPTVLFEGRGYEAYDLEQLKAKAQNQTVWLVDGHLAKPKYGVLPQGALKPGEFALNFAAYNYGHDEDAMNETRETVVKAYIQSMRHMVESQKQVMLQFLGAEQDLTATIDRSGASALPVPELKVAALQKAAAPVVAAAVAAAPVVLDIAATVLAVVSQKTGYPAEMLDLDQDLEADLSIDSIKRFEILAELGERLGDRLSESRGALEKLAWIKTLRQLITALESQVAAAGAPAASAPAEVPSAPEKPAEAAALELPVSQYLFRIEEAPLPIEPLHNAVKGHSYTILQDKRGVAAPLAELLKDGGATVKILPLTELPDHESADGLILLPLLDEFGSNPKDVFMTVQHACRKNVHSIIGVTGRGGHFGHQETTGSADQNRGISGLFKSLAKEYSEKTVKIIDLDLHEAPESLAAHVYAELLAGDPLVEVGYHGGLRRQIVAVPLLTELGQEKLSLNQDSVVLMLGGARGIAAQVATKIAEQYSCRFEIVGRTPAPLEELAETKDIEDLQGLRNFFVKSGRFKKPAEVEAECRRILNDREMNETFAKLQSLGSRYSYHCFDVRDKDKLSALIDQLYAKGRIDGVIHAAGVLRDSLILEKSAEAFSLVFETKVNPAEVLEEKLQSDVKFVALFSSVSGCFGNRGQTDYAAANNALDRVARNLGKKVDGRTLSINWGPWGGTGMVTPELENEYRRRGIGLIPPQVGSQRFLDELRFGDRSTRQVVIMSGSPESFGYS